MLNPILRGTGRPTGRVNKCGKCRLPKRTLCICSKGAKSSQTRVIDDRSGGAAFANIRSTRDYLDQESDPGSECYGSDVEVDEDVLTAHRDDGRFDSDAEDIEIIDELTDDPMVADIIVGKYKREEVEISAVQDNALRSSSSAYTFRREQPAFEVKRGEKSGPANISSGRTSPMDIFDLLWTDEILDTFVKSTNEFAHNKGRKRWKPVTKACLNGFFAIALYTGLKKTPVRRWLWDQSQPLHYAKSYRIQ